MGPGKGLNAVNVKITRNVVHDPLLGGHGSLVDSFFDITYPRNSKPETRNPKIEGQNPNLYTRTAKPEPLNPKPPKHRYEIKLGARNLTELCHGVCEDTEGSFLCM